MIEKLIRTLLIGCFLVFLQPSVIWAQDVNFNQIFTIPQLLNPALTGDIDGTFRVYSLNRDQWRPALGRSLRSFVFGGDAKFYVNQNSGGKDLFAGGITFYSDRTSLFDFYTNHISLSGAFHKSLNPNKNEYISVGLNFGVSQMGVNYENIYFEDQFNQIDKYDLPTNEYLPPNSLAYPSLAIGFHYKKSITKDRHVFMGIAGYNLLKDEVSFYAAVNDLNAPFKKSNILLRKVNSYIGLKLRANESLTWSPRIRYSMQLPYQEISLSATARQQFYTTKGMALHFGGGLQLGNINDQLGLKRVALQAGYEINGLILGVSYDHNFNDFIRKYGGMGSVELSITYIGEHENDFEFCPTF